jgi:hypothetical protein
MTPPLEPTGVGRRSPFRPAFVLQVLAPVLICTGLYLATRTSVHTFDALSYILDVDRKPLRELFHPHHLAYGPLGALIRACLDLVGRDMSAEVPLQIVNSLAGAIGLGLWSVAALRAGAGRLATLAGALLIGWSYAYWYYAVEVEVYTIAALFLSAALILLVELGRRPRIDLALGLGLLQAAAVLFHQTNVLLSVPALLVFVPGMSRAIDSIDLRRRLLLIGAYAVPLLVLVGGAYLFVGVGVSGLSTWAALRAWMAGYTTTGWWGGPIGRDSWQDLGQGLSETLMQPGGAAVGLILLVLPAVRWKRLVDAPRRLVLACLAWLLVYGGFFFWWEPDNIEFWIASLPPFGLLLALAATPSGDGDRREHWPSAILLALALVMLTVNTGTILRRGDATRDLQRVIAAALAERGAAGDLFLVPDGVLELYLPFYAQRDSVYSLNQALTAAAGDWPQACAAVQARIEQTLASGQRVLIAETAIRPVPAGPDEPATPLERFQLTPAQVEACYAPFAAMLAPLPLAADLPDYAYISNPAELLQADGWDFRRGDWGWRMRQAQDLGHTDAGWRMVPTVDPSIASPPFQFDTARYAAIEVRLAATTTARDAQLFLIDGQGQADEARSLRFTLEPGPAPHTYRLDLGTMSGVWAGLRLDPVGSGSGGEVTLVWLRLVPKR